MGLRRWTPLLPWAAAILIGVLYLPVLGCDYVWDDWLLFIHNPALRRPELVWHAIFSPVLPGTAYFRPVVLSSFVLEFAGIGVNATLSHAVNLLLHLCNSVLVGLIALRLTAEAKLRGQAWRVLLATLLYGLHPALIEPTTWVAGRFDLMVTFFCLLGIRGYLALADWKRNLWVTLCFLLAALSKEMAATLPLLLLLFYLGRQSRTATWPEMTRTWVACGEWRLWAFLAIAGLGVIAARIALMGYVAQSDLSVRGMIDGPIHHLAFIGQTLLFYVRMSLWPFSDLNPQHPLNPTDLDTTARWIGVISLSLAILALALLIRVRNWTTLLLAGWLIALLPVMNIVLIGMAGNIGQERFLALPLAFLVLGVATLPPPLLSPGMTRILPVLIGGLAAGFLTLSIVNIRVTLPLWKSELSLWSWAYARYPNRLTVQLGYTTAALHYQQYHLARAALDAAEQPLSYALAIVDGEYLLKTGHPAEALPVLERALAVMQSPHKVVLSMGIPLDEASLAEPDPLDWFHRSAYTSLAETHLALNHFQQALESSQIALFYSPRYPTALLFKAFALYGLDRWDEAESTAARASSYFVPKAQAETREYRTLFLTQLCGAATPPTTVCANWHATQASRPSPQAGSPSTVETPDAEQQR